MNLVLQSVDPSLIKRSSHAAGRFRIFSNRSRNNGNTCSSLTKGTTMLNSGALISRLGRNAATGKIHGTKCSVFRSNLRCIWRVQSCKRSSVAIGSNALWLHIAPLASLSALSEPYSIVLHYAFFFGSFCPVKFFLARVESSFVTVAPVKS
jgi:hypothetical protein